MSEIPLNYYLGGSFSVGSLHRQFWAFDRGRRKHHLIVLVLKFIKVNWKQCLTDLIILLLQLEFELFILQISAQLEIICPVLIYPFIIKQSRPFRVSVCSRVLRRRRKIPMVQSMDFMISLMTIYNDDYTAGAWACVCVDLCVRMIRQRVFFVPHPQFNGAHSISG